MTIRRALELTGVAIIGLGLWAHDGYAIAAGVGLWWASTAEVDAEVDPPRRR